MVGPKYKVFVAALFLFQEEAEVTEALYHMSTGENLLRQKEERLKMLESTFANDLVGNICFLSHFIKALMYCRN